jgi:hypothetical protein
MKKFLFLIFLSTSIFATDEWKMESTNSGLVFLYNTKTGETYRYFESGQNVGFGKVTFHKNIKLNPVLNNQQKVDTTNIINEILMKQKGGIL